MISFKEENPILNVDFGEVLIIKSDEASVFVKVEQTKNGVIITATDSKGTTSATVMNGYTPQKGVDYFTPKDIAELGISKIKEDLEVIESIAKGRATGYVFDTVEDLDLWLQDENNTSQLVLGDNFYIRELDVPDYWWDGTQKQQLETQKVDLSEYYTKSEADEQAWVAAASYDSMVLSEKFAAKADVRSYVNIENDENYIHFGALGLSDNTEYVASEPISTLHLMYPEGDFICSLYFTLASEGDITITLPESKYIGETPDFKNGETWELSIKNGVVVGGKVV